jgi:hypothetical protein
MLVNTPEVICQGKVEMSYTETAKLSDLTGGQDGRKGHNHGEAEGFKAVACDSQNN